MKSKKYLWCDFRGIFLWAFPPDPFPQDFRAWNIFPKTISPKIFKPKISPKHISPKNSENRFPLKQKFPQKKKPLVGAERHYVYGGALDAV